MFGFFAKLFFFLDFSGFFGPGEARGNGEPGGIQKIKKFKILFWSRESKKQIFLIFPDFVYEKLGKSKIATFLEIAISGNRNLVGLVIASETPL